MIDLDSLDYFGREKLSHQNYIRLIYIFLVVLKEEAPVLYPDKSGPRCSKHP